MASPTDMLRHAWDSNPRLMALLVIGGLAALVISAVRGETEGKWKKQAQQLRKLQIKQLQGGSKKDGAGLISSPVIPGQTQGKQLIPLQIGVPLLLMAIVLHFVWSWFGRPWPWLLALLLGPACAIAMYFLGGKKWGSRAFALAAWLGATAWVALIWILGLWLPALIFAGLHILGCEIHWWRHWSIRSKVLPTEGEKSLLGGLRARFSRWLSPSGSREASDRRNLERITQKPTWSLMMEGAGLKGVELKRVEPPDGKGWTFHLGLPSNLPYAALVAKSDVLATALDHARIGGSPVIADRLQFSRGTEGAARCRLRVTLVDPLASGCVYPGPSADTIKTPLVLGRYEDGGSVELDIRQSHTMAGGMTGSGKSGALNVIMAELAGRRDVLIWGLDIRKRGAVELKPWLRVMDRLAKTPEEAEELLEALVRIHAARSEWMAEREIRDWPISPEFPLLVVVIDELKGVMRLPACCNAVDELIEVGRQQGIILVMATQRPTAENLGGGLDARGNCAIRIALQTEKEGDSRLILGDDLVREGWKAHALPPQGYAYLKIPGPCEPRRLRFFHMDDAAVRETGEGCAALRPKLDAVSAAALEVPQIDAGPEPEWEGTQAEFAEMIGRSISAASRRLTKLIEDGKARRVGRVWQVFELEESA